MRELFLNHTLRFVPRLLLGFWDAGEFMDGISGRYFRLILPLSAACPRNERFLDAALAHWFHRSIGLEGVLEHLSDDDPLYPSRVRGWSDW